MLILIYGNDYKSKKAKSDAVLKTLKKQRPDALFSHLDFLDLTVQKLNELVATTGGLFEEKNITLFTNIFCDLELKKSFLEKLPEIAESDNAFVLNEDNLEARDLKKIKKYAWKVFAFEKKELKVEFNIFSISDSLQSKNIKNLWLNYHKALLSGLAPEQIFSNIFFALKTLSLAEKFSEKDSGLKSFPYKKARENLAKWKENEVDEKIFKLISTYNHSRVAGLNLKDAIEKFILEL